MKTYIDKSNIHGNGLFANKIFMKNSYIGEYIGTPTGRNSKYVLWVDSLGLLVKNEFKYVNHNSKPNCELRGCKLYSLRHINKYDELTIHYGEDFK